MLKGKVALLFIACLLTLLIVGCQNSIQSIPVSTIGILPTYKPSPLSDTIMPTETPEHNPTNPPSLPTPTIIIPTIFSPDTPGLVKSVDEITGKWLSRCGGGSCIWEFNSDGRYKSRYYPPTESGISVIESGTITFSEGIFHFSATNGFCESDLHGYYQATLDRKDGVLFLKFTPVQKDDCPDRQNTLTREMPYYDK